MRLMARSPRPCVCDLQLPRCDASCNRQMLETTFYMACLHLTDRPCLVVGAGPVALEKIEGLLACDARVTVVAPEAIDAIAGLAGEGTITWHRRPYETADLEGSFMVVAATSDTDLNVGVFRDAEARQMLVNVVDVPPLCNFILPAIVRAGPLAIAISTAGASPALAKRIKSEIAEQFGEPYARLAIMLNDARGWAKATLPTYQDRKRFFEEIVNGEPDPVELVREGREREVLDLIEAAKGTHGATVGSQ
ncbi:MAG: precorrin-2 dehydrogenase [Solirubrobacteraceae bacterium]|nr:precorrin-2 dehydrogenase [Solirubrobacteraceae bacterium]